MTIRPRFAVLLLLSAWPALAGDTPPPPPPAAERSIYDRIWALPTIHKDKENAFLQEFRFTGRLNLDTYSIDSDLGYDQDWVVRRLRGGFRAKLLHRLEARVEVDLQPQNPDPLYGRLTDAYLAWTFSDAAVLTVGKQTLDFTLDGATSSNELLTIDRNNLSNNLYFTEQYVPGITLGGEHGPWRYLAGFFSGGSASPEFGNFDAGNFVLASLGYDFAAQMGVKQALLRADYVYNDPNAGSTFTRRLEQVGSLVFILDDERWGVSADLAAARGTLGQSDLFGVNVMPWLRLTRHLQLVGRYTHVRSDEPNGVRFARYENALTAGRGEEYDEFYAGLNYYLYGHKLKVQTGFAHVTMQDEAADGGAYHGWSWTTALRVSF